MVPVSSKWKDEHLDFHCDLKKNPKLLKGARFSVINVATCHGCLELGLKREEPCTAMQKCIGIFSQPRNDQEDSLPIIWLNQAVLKVSLSSHCPAVLHLSLLL